MCSFFKGLLGGEPKRQAMPVTSAPRESGANVLETPTNQDLTAPKRSRVKTNTQAGVAGLSL